MAKWIPIVEYNQARAVPMEPLERFYLFRESVGRALASRAALVGPETDVIEAIRNGLFTGRNGLRLRFDPEDSGMSIMERVFLYAHRMPLYFLGRGPKQPAYGLLAEDGNLYLTEKPLSMAELIAQAPGVRQPQRPAAMTRLKARFRADCREQMKQYQVQKTNYDAAVDVYLRCFGYNPKLTAPVQRWKCEQLALLFLHRGTEQLYENPGEMDAVQHFLEKNDPSGLLESPAAQRYFRCKLGQELGEAEQSLPDLNKAACGILTELDDLFADLMEETNGLCVDAADRMRHEARQAREAAARQARKNRPDLRTKNAERMIVRLFADDVPFARFLLNKLYSGTEQERLAVRNADSEALKAVRCINWDAEAGCLKRDDLPEAVRQGQKLSQSVRSGRTQPAAGMDGGRAAW